MEQETIAIHGGYETDATTKAVAVPIFQTVAYEFDDAKHGADLFDLAVPGNIYTRIMNPTNAVLEARMAAMEGGLAALAVGSGMAAINYSILTLAAAGNNIITVPQLYGGTYTLFAHMLPSQGIEVRFAGMIRRRRWKSSLTGTPAPSTAKPSATPRAISSTWSPSAGWRAGTGWR